MKQFTTLCLTAILLLTCGCSLAQPAPETEALSGDQLVGVVVTTEYLDLFDMEAWLNDNIDQLNIGGTTQISGDTAKYEGRIYTRAIETPSKGSDGSTRILHTWEFPESLETIMGGMFICPTVTDPKSGEQYTSSISNGAVSDAHTHVKSTDYGDSIELSCTVYFDPYSILTETLTDAASGVEMEHIAFYTNPVYQTPDGDVYVTSGMGNSYSVEKELGMDSFRSSSTLTDSKSETVNGKTTSLENKITVTFQGVRMAQSIAVLEMNAQNKLLRTKTYTPENFPTEIAAGEDAAYIIVETVSVDTENNETVSRQICSADHPDETFDIFVPANNGFAIKQTTKVVTK